VVKGAKEIRRSPGSGKSRAWRPASEEHRRRRDGKSLSRCFLKDGMMWLTCAIQHEVHSYEITWFLYRRLYLLMILLKRSSSWPLTR
jgi:hypothetical protein